MEAHTDVQWKQRQKEPYVVSSVSVEFTSQTSKYEPVVTEAQVEMEG